MDFSFGFRGVSFPSLIMNASGPLCTSLAELEGLGESKSGAIVFKSTTVEPRQGNEKPKYFENEFGSINSNGLENPGYKEYCGFLPKLKRFKKPLIPSIVGFSLSELEILVTAFDNAGADAIEVNLSCPNIQGKPQVAYDFAQSEKYLEAIRPLTSKPLFVKLPPYLETVHRQEMASILLKQKVDAITLINSIGNSLIIDPEKEQTVIKPKNGLGGIGGKYIKPVALGNVLTFYQELKERIPIIGAGGIFSGTDAFEFLLCGAKLLQIGTAYKSEGAGVFERVALELGAVLERKGYENPEEAVGKLKVVKGEEYGFGA